MLQSSASPPASLIASCTLFHVSGSLRLSQALWAAFEILSLKSDQLLLNSSPPSWVLQSKIPWVIFWVRSVLVAFFRQSTPACVKTQASSLHSSASPPASLIASCILVQVSGSLRSSQVPLAASEILSTKSAKEKPQTCATENYLLATCLRESLWNVNPGFQKPSFFQFNNTYICSSSKEIPGWQWKWWLWRWAGCGLRPFSENNFFFLSKFHFWVFLRDVSSYIYIVILQPYIHSA